MSWSEMLNSPSTSAGSEGGGGPNVDVLRVLAARSAELAACEASVHLATARAVSALQRLPVRLRRRAASHRPSRIPRRCRADPVLVASQKAVKQARRCRRYRRRPQRLAALAARRALLPVGVQTGDCKGVRWIPTALWHAKRFQVVQNWGWRLPFAPTDKMFKALQRATADRCMLLDHGYMSCFALSGPRGLLQRCIQETTLPFYVSSVGIDAQNDTTTAWPHSFRETVGLFCREAVTLQQQKSSSGGVAQLPNISRAVLGPVRILWSPLSSKKDTEDPEDRLTLWLWLHPSMSTDAWSLLASLSYVCVDLEGDSSDRIRLVDCTGHLCRMRLIGPFAHQVLVDLLKPASSEQPSSGGWALWKALSAYQKAGLFPIGCAVPLMCGSFLKDRPKLKLCNRNWLIPEPKMERGSGCQLSGSFASKVLSRTELHKLHAEHCDSAFNGLLTQWFSSPKPCCFSDVGIPVLIVQNGTPSLMSHKSHSVGWDVILPRQMLKSAPKSTQEGNEANVQPAEGSADDPAASVDTAAARDLVVACAYRGVRVGGLRDQLRWATLTTEAAARVDAFPYVLWPDTPAARLVTDEKSHLKIERDAKGRLTGDAKRRARIKFRKDPPTTNDWLQLLNAVSPPSLATDNTFFVLRDKAMLVLVVRRLFAGDSLANHLTVDYLLRYDPRLPRALIMVQLEVSSRGIPGSKMPIYAPQPTDDPTMGAIVDEKPRKLLGYVDEGAYAFSHGICIAIGFVSLAAVCALPQEERLPKGLQTVLFKSSKSGDLHGAKMTVIV